MIKIHRYVTFLPTSTSRRLAYSAIASFGVPLVLLFLLLLINAFLFLLSPVYELATWISAIDTVKLAAVGIVIIAALFITSQLCR